jgi:hypothetical protein
MSKHFRHFRYSQHLLLLSKQQALTLHHFFAALDDVVGLDEIPCDISKPAGAYLYVLGNAFQYLSVSACIHFQIYTDTENLYLVCICMYHCIWMNWYVFGMYRPKDTVSVCICTKDTVLTKSIHTYTNIYIQIHAIQSDTYRYTAPLAKLAQGESGVPANLVRTAWVQVQFLPPPARSMLRAFHQAVCLPLLRFQ